MKRKKTQKTQRSANVQKRQGDIFFERSDKPTSKKPLTNNVLAYGEVTGHSHKIMSPAFSELETAVDEKGEIWVLSPNSDIEIAHDEHDPIVLDKGVWWHIFRQREYNPISAMNEKVRD